MLVYIVNVNILGGSVHRDIHRHLVNVSKDIGLE